MFKKTILIFSLLLLSLPAFAVEYIVTRVDGTQLFRCEYLGKEYKISVKYRGENRYTILRYGSGKVKFSGEVQTNSHAAAASKGCGE